MNPLGEMLLIFGLILLNGFFAASEMAILTARPSRLAQRAKNGSRGAKVAMNLASEANRFLSTVQVGITLVGTFAAAYGGSRLAVILAERLLHAPIDAVARNASTISLGIVTATIAFFSLVFGELVPKRLALQSADVVATWAAYPMYVISLVARPFIAVLSAVTAAVLSLFSLFGFRGDQANNAVTVEDIRHLIESGKEQGVLEGAERAVALEAIRLGDRKVRDIMRPRIDIEAVDVETPSREVVGVMAMSGFSRLPVYEESLDHILGFVYIKDIFQRYYMGGPINLRSLIHPPLFVPDTLTVDRLLERFQQGKSQLAVVLDEFGGTEGIVTVEDIVEELVGKMHDEHRQDEDQMIVPRGDASWLVDGLVTLSDLARVIGSKGAEWTLPLDISTVSGLVISQLQRPPRIGESIEWQGIKLEVIDMDGPRIDRVLVEILMKPVSDPTPKE